MLRLLARPAAAARPPAAASAAQRAGRAAGTRPAVRGVRVPSCRQVVLRAARDGGAGQQPPSFDTSQLRGQLQGSAGGAWPPEAEARFSRVAESLGGWWFLAECGEYTAAAAEQGYPRRVGSPARVVVNVKLLQLPERGVAAGVTTAVLAAASIVALDAPLRGAPRQHYALSCFEVDEQGWPTGRMFNSPTALSNLTTEILTRKPRQALRLLSPPDGEGPRSLETWLRRQLEAPFGVTTVPRPAILAVRVWYRDLVAAAGGEVMIKLSAPEIYHAARLREEQQRPRRES